MIINKTKKIVILIISIVLVITIILSYNILYRNNIDKSVSELTNNVNVNNNYIRYKEYKEYDDFNKLVNSVHTDLVASDDCSLYNAYYEKTKAGFTNVPYKPVVMTEDLFNQYMNQCEKVLDNIKKFDYTKLSKEQQMNYDIISNYLERELLYKDFYIYYMTFNSLTYFDQYYTMLTKRYPTAREEIDMLIDIYINSIKDIDLVCKLIEIQLDEKVITKNDITSLKNLCNIKYVKKIFSDIVDNCDFITKKEKNQYKEELNNQIVKTGMEKELVKKTKAIDKLEKQYENLSTVKNNISIFSSTKEGKLYYEACAKREFGLNMDVKSLKKYLLDKATEIKKEINRYKNEKGISPIYKTCGEKINYSLKNSYLDIYNDLCDIYIKYFPECDNLTCDLYYTELPNGIGGRYRSISLDQPFSHRYILFNEDFKQEYYTIVAHESVPGHLYEDTYKINSNIPDIRKYDKYMSYCDGWAKYVENYVTNNYQIIDKDKAIVYNLCNELKFIYRSLGEIYVNYDGWDRDKFLEFYKENIPDEDTNFITNNAIYDTLLNSQFYYSKYSVYNLKFQDLYNLAKEKLGDKFSDIEFHKVILDCGQTDISIIEKNIYEYIEINS